VACGLDRLFSATRWSKTKHFLPRQRSALGHLLEIAKDPPLSKTGAPLESLLRMNSLAFLQRYAAGAEQGQPAADAPHQSVESRSTPGWKVAESWRCPIDRPVELLQVTSLGDRVSDPPGVLGGPRSVVPLLRRNSLGLPLRR